MYQQCLREYFPHKNVRPSPVRNVSYGIEWTCQALETGPNVSDCEACSVCGSRRIRELYELPVVNQNVASILGFDGTKPPAEIECFDESGKE